MSPCYHSLSALAIGSFHNRALYKCPITLLTLLLYYPSAAGRAQDRVSSPAKDRRSANCAIRNQTCTKLVYSLDNDVLEMKSVPNVSGSIH